METRLQLPTWGREAGPCPHARRVELNRDSGATCSYNPPRRYARRLWTGTRCSTRSSISTR